MVPDSYHEFFVAIVGAAGALIGLLFVAVSVVSRRLRDPGSTHLSQSQASAALLVFSNSLALGLFALIPVHDLAWATVAVSFLGILYSLSVGRVAFARSVTDQNTRRQLRRIAVGALVISGFEMYGGVEMLVHPASIGGVQTIATTMIVAVIFGISRAWELVGLPDTGLLHSLRVLRDPATMTTKPGPEEAAA
jgi:hypothetical protein